MRLMFFNEGEKAHYVGIITWEGEIEIESCSIPMEQPSEEKTWSEGDRLSAEDINGKFNRIYAESWAYTAAVELGIKVTHREAAPDCGTYCTVKEFE